MNYPISTYRAWKKYTVQVLYMKWLSSQKEINIVFYFLFCFVLPLMSQLILFMYTEYSIPNISTRFFPNKVNWFLFFIKYFLRNSKNNLYKSPCMIQIFFFLCNFSLLVACFSECKVLLFVTRAIGLITGGFEADPSSLCFHFIPPQIQREIYTIFSLHFH